MEAVLPGRWRNVVRDKFTVPVPRPIRERIDAECSSDEEKMSTMINYIVTIIPDLTWEKITNILYTKDEHMAVERVKPYLHVLPGESLVFPLRLTAIYLTKCAYIQASFPGPTLYTCTKTNGKPGIS